MSLIGTLLGYALTAFILLMIARLVLAWTQLLANGPGGVVALGYAEVGETVDPTVGQIARVSSSKAAITRKVIASSAPSS